MATSPGWRKGLMATAELPRLLTPPPSSAATILLFGELLVDCFPDREVVGGAPFNVARHLIGLVGGVGVDPVLVTRIGKDARGVRCDARSRHRHAS
jgi:hypothetical protein